jgi:serine/threonine protein kinase
LNLLAILGQGAFGKVFLSKIDSAYYAVKMLGKKQIIDKNMAANVKLEIKTMQDLKHPHLLGINYVTNMTQAIFISMPFSRGGDLSNLFKDVRDRFRCQLSGIKQDETSYFHERQILWWAQQIISGIGALHKENLVHKDIKTPNILIGEDMKVVVCDFGLVEKVPEG